METAHVDRFNKEKKENNIIQILTEGVKFKFNDPRQKKLNMHLVYMIVKSFQSFRLVEREEFRFFVKALNPKYNCPTRKTVANTLIPKAYTRVQDRMKTDFSSIKHITIASDLGSSLVNDSYNSVTAHYLDPKTLKLETKTLQCQYFPERHFAANLEIDIEKCLNEYKVR